MAPVVYGSVVSTRTQRVLLVLEELGITYDFRPLDIAKAEHRDPKYIEDHHPFAKVPAFEDDDAKIFESRAICRYLVDKHSSSLGPSSGNPKALAAFEQAASVDYAYFEPAVSALGFELIFKKRLGLGETNETVVAQQRAQLGQALDYYEKTLESRRYLAGENYTLVDLFHIPWLGFIRNRLQLGEEIDSRKNVKAWSQRLSEREATKTVVAKASQR